MAKTIVDLDERYILDAGRIYTTGMQVLVRLPLQQAMRDKKAGLNTAGYISGYRGSPLGAYDEELHRAKKHLEAQDVLFVPGVNEDLAATAVWGTQQAELTGEGKYDGVFSIWYGKGPGVDRSGDVFRHGNFAGTSKNGGVLVLAGDDHTCESSTTCHQSEYALLDAGIPILSPSTLQELLDFGQIGWAMSRFSGCWVGLKCVKDIADATGSIDINVDRIKINEPVDYEMPADGLNIRIPDTPQDQEKRLYQYKLEAVRAFIRANNINTVIANPEKKKIGLVTHGKSYGDVFEALGLLDLSLDELERLGVGLYKVGCTWPLEPTGITDFATGYEKLFIVEEKRGLLESQVKEILYHHKDGPAVIGKKDEYGQRLLQEELALSPVQIALALGERLSDHGEIRERVERLKLETSQSLPTEPMRRSFYFCAGCPHSTSTVLPEGSTGYAGIGCSWMAQMMDRQTQGYTHMGGEGMSWVGEEPFSKRKHMFQNIGDGTYFHSGLLAVRGAVSAQANITFKILFNDAVAMTGGQNHDGQLNPAVITRQVSAEGVKRIAVVTDEPKKYPADTQWASGTTIHHRDELNTVQEMLREVEGVTVLVYDQTCAAELRRRRRRNLAPTPDKRLVINEMVCEGCGDCSRKSNCVAVVPLETELGRKREIDQSACNLDFSCDKGFCPSFISVEGAKLSASARQNIVEIAREDLTEPNIPELSAEAYSIVLTGVGGTGIVTVGALIGMAAHIEGLGYGMLDMAGLAQKGGSVWSHIKIAPSQAEVQSYRIAPATANMVLGCDVVVSASEQTLRLARPGKTKFIISDHQVMTGDFTRNPDMQFPMDELVKNIELVVGQENVNLASPVEWAKSLFGNTIYANIMLLGFAYQNSLIPIKSESIEQAIRVNNVSVDMNIQAFRWGRMMAINPGEIGKVIKMPSKTKSKSLEDSIDYRREYLINYQNKLYSDRYIHMLDSVKKWEEEFFPGKNKITQAVAKYYFKVLAYKDEYEIARLHASSEFQEKMSGMFGGAYDMYFHLAPPILSKKDPITGEPMKRRFKASYMTPIFKVLSKMKFLRGTVFDIFGKTEERKMERDLIVKYEEVIKIIKEKCNGTDYEAAVNILSFPEQIRGFGHIKKESFDRSMAQLKEDINNLGKTKVIELKRIA